MLHKFWKYFRDYSFFLSEAKYKEKIWKGVKILTPKQIFQRLPIALAKVKAGSMSKNLPNEIGKIMYSFYLAIEITKKVSNNIKNSIKL